MGKPFLQEMAMLPRTYAWALKQDTSELERFVHESLGQPLIAVASGGAFTAATYAAHLHESLTGQASLAMTPLEFGGQDRMGSSVLFLSAGGTNPDITGAFHAAISQDTKKIGLVCFRAGSKLALLARTVSADSFIANLPSGGDGFLATNSLVAFFIMLFRSYGAVFALPKLESDYERINSDKLAVERDVRAAVERPHLIALFGPTMRALATDLESKFSEAGLNSVQLTDFRNFAHGRHHWIAKRASETGIIAFISPDVERIARSTLKLLAGRVPIATITSSGSPESMIAGLSAVFRFTAIAGAVRGIDPGRPGVPEFGRRIYHLRATPRVRRAGAPPSLAIMARRKVSSVWRHLGEKEQKGWIYAASAFSKRLRATQFGSVIFDFDGTICSRRERFTALRADITSILEDFLRHKIIVGIATGRGKSVGKQLRDSISSEYWERVWIAYYNGGNIAILADEHKPDIHQEIHPAIDHARQIISTETSFLDIASTTVRPTQISIEPKVLMTSQDLWKYTVGVLERNHADVRVIYSTHSVDIVPRSVAKSVLVHKLQGMMKERLVPLCIGDLGQYPGNDFDLLAWPNSLSSDQVSADTDSCWNMAPLAVRGIDATLYYLQHAKVENGRFRLHLPVSYSPKLGQSAKV